jgi:hypothetical protein
MTQHDDEHHFGVCPHCHKTDGYEHEAPDLE